MRSYLPVFIFALCLTCVSACAPSRSTLRPGVIPEAPKISSADEDYGFKVAYELSKQFPLDNDTRTNDQVRRIVSQLSQATSTRSPWKIYVYESARMKNAAATRGNFVFVWSGLLEFTRNDAELATVLSHEMGHVLAGHTQSDPVEESRTIASGIAGEIGRQALMTQGNAIGMAAGIAGAVIEEGFKALLLNPELQRKEFEADQVGLFLMADAGYNPQAAVDFWRRASKDPDLAGSRIDVFSSHPSSEDREKRIDELLPQAMHRYRRAASGNSSQSQSLARDQNPPPKPGPAKSRDAIAPVFDAASVSSVIIGELPPHTEVMIAEVDGKWCRIEKPIPGYLRVSDLAK